MNKQKILKWVKIIYITIIVIAFACTFTANIIIFDMTLGFEKYREVNGFIYLSPSLLIFVYDLMKRGIEKSKNKPHPLVYVCLVLTIVLLVAIAKLTYNVLLDVKLNGPYRDFMKFPDSFF